MPPLLLDAHLARALAEALARRGVDAVHLATWQDGRWRMADDDVVLAAAAAAGRVIVTLDAATLPAIARRWSEEGRPHAGLLVLSSRLNQRDIGGQLEAILATVDEREDRPWANLVVFARRRR
jgi:predicted nuclease of predicted toxin-antitoxin system